MEKNRSEGGKKGKSNHGFWARKRTTPPPPTQKPKKKNDRPKKGRRGGNGSRFPFNLKLSNTDREESKIIGNKGRREGAIGLAGLTSIPILPNYFISSWAIYKTLPSPGELPRRKNERGKEKKREEKRGRGELLSPCDLLVSSDIETCDSKPENGGSGGE